jgi:hypothetical protein
VGQAADVLHQVRRHLAGIVGTQGQRIDKPAKPLADCRGDLVVAADRGKEVGDIVRHLRGHLVPPRQRVELVAEIFEPVHRQHRVVGRRRAVECNALPHPFEVTRDALVVRSGGKL